nr:putative ribonuclease H-like domain-containing protein [Tanacetum cinerariifolium]
VNEDQSKGSECKDQEKQDDVNSTNNVNTVSLTINATNTNEHNELLFDPNMPVLEDVGTFDFSNEDKDDDVVADMNNLDTTFQVTPTLTTRIHKDHPLDQMSSMGELTFFLGLQVKQKNDSIFISQDKYVAESLMKFGFIEVKKASTPMETQKPLLKDEDGEEVDVHMYRSTIGSLMYLTYSRPNIMFAVCACARYQVNPKVSHIYAVKKDF